MNSVLKSRYKCMKMKILIILICFLLADRMLWCLYRFNDNNALEISMDNTLPATANMQQVSEAQASSPLEVESSSIEEAINSQTEEVYPEIDEKKMTEITEEDTVAQSNDPATACIKEDQMDDYYIDQDIVVVHEDMPEEESSSQLAASTANWKREDVLKLIALYKEAQPLFKSPTTKKRKLWQQIAEKLPPYSDIQCENKFKYLKSRYRKKIENMRGTGTGSRRIYCEFFEELSLIFGKPRKITLPTQPCTPCSPCTASSSKGSKNLPDKLFLENESDNGESTSEETQSSSTHTTKRKHKLSILKDAEKVKKRKQEQLWRERAALAYEKIASALEVLADKMQSRS